MHIIVKRLLCAVLALAMVITYTPATAYAADAAGQAGINAGQTASTANAQSGNAAAGTQSNNTAANAQSGSNTTASTQSGNAAANAQSANSAEDTQSSNTTANAQSGSIAAAAPQTTSKPYTITYYYKTGSTSIFNTEKATVSGDTQTMSLTTMKPAQRKSDGYIFAGWADSQGQKIDPADYQNKVISGDMSFYALWKIPQINYYDGVGSSNLLFTENATSWDTNRWTVVITNKIPVKKGYIFAGWADAEGHHVSASQMLNNPRNISSDMSYYALWTPTAATKDSWAAERKQLSGTTDSDGTCYIDNVSQATDSSKIYKICSIDSVGWYLYFHVTYVIPKGYKGDTITFDPAADAQIDSVMKEYAMSPSDRLYLSVDFINNSDKEFDYKNGSLIVSTAKLSSEESGDVKADTYTSFDGQEFISGQPQPKAKYTVSDAIVALEKEQQGYSTLAEAEDYVSKTNKVSDDIAAYLKSHNITLGQYYLKYYADKYGIDLSKIKNPTLKDLPLQALVDMTSGNYTLGDGTNDPEVNAIQYDYLYNRALGLYLSGSNNNPVDKSGNEVDYNTLNNLFINSIGSYMRGQSDGTVETAFGNLWGKTAAGSSSGTIPMLYYLNAYAPNIYHMYPLDFTMNATIIARKYTVKVNYLEKGTNKILAEVYTTADYVGKAYDVTAATQKEISGYTRDSVTTGDTASGILNADKDITVWYSKTETPVVPEPSTAKGSITVSKSTLTQTGQTAKISGTFYMELFSDADCTKAVSKPQAVTVTNGTKASTTFTGLSEGTYYVAETNAEGTQIITKPADTTSYTGYGVDGNKTAVMISSSSLTGSAAIVNRYTPAGNKTPKPKHDPSTPGKTTPSGGSPATGDDFNAGLMMMLLFLGTAGAVTPFAIRRKDEEE